MRIGNVFSYHTKQSFGKNKIYVYSDFDRTISPNTTGDVFYAQDRQKLDKAKYNFELINELLKKYKDMTLFITTGRTNDELRLMYDLYKKQGIVFPEAESVFTKEGSDEILKDKTIKDDYPYVKSNEIRNNKISAKTGWNKYDINKKALDIIKENGLEPLECGSTLSAEKYGKYSVFSFPEKISENTVLVRDVGKMKFFLGFVDEIPQEKYDSVKNSLQVYLKENNINYVLKEKSIDHECHKYRSMMFMPVIDEQPLSKNYDIKERIKTADDTDIVIVAGDGKNDVDMLNPLSYIDSFEKDDIKNLNFLGIIVEKEKEKEPELEKLNETFGQNTQLKKTVKIKEGDLADELRKIAESKYGF